jgi:hypothetical protein
MRTTLLAIALSSVLLASCGSEPEVPADVAMPDPAPPAEAPASTPFPDVIVAERGGFIPEGVEYDRTNGRILTGSLSEGSILEIHPDGRVSTVVADPDLVSSVGIEVDEARDRLLVANSDRAAFDGSSAGQAELAVYDLTSGDRIALVDLAAAVTNPPDDAAYFANDVAVSDDGTVYVTDTMLNAVYEVTRDYEASLLHRFDDEAGGPNGIEVHPAGYLLVARGAELWKIPLSDPASATAVALPEAIPGGDGIVWSAGRLAIVSNSDSRVVALTSTDDWATAEVAGVATFDTPATTAAVIGDDVYVVHPTFEGDDPPSVSRVTFQ